MKYVVVGGGIAGVCCAEELCRLAPDDQITLLSSDTVLKVRELLQANVTSNVHHVSSTHSGQPALSTAGQTPTQELPLSC